MIGRSLCALAGAALSGGVVTLLWWVALLVCLGAAGGSLFPRSLAESVETTKGLVVTFLPTPLGVIQGGLIGWFRGRFTGEVVREVLWAPFAWILTAGEGMSGSVLLLLSLMPGACVGMLIGYLFASNDQELPDEAVVGALIGVVLSLLAFNLCLQWPGLRGKPQGEAEGRD